MTMVHLHGHNEYSLLDGCGTAKEHAAAAAGMNQPALASTNHGTLAGTLHHMNACREAGILPIVGCEVYYRPQRKVQGQKELRYFYFHLTLLAKNATGWHNLMRLTSEANISGFYEKPCVDLEILQRYSEGVICGLGCLGSWFSHCIEEGDSTAAHGWVRQLKNIYGDDLFGEIMPSKIDDQVARNPPIIQVCQDESVMLAATVDAHAPDKASVGTQDVLLMISTNQTLKKREAKRKEGVEVFEFKDDTYYLQSESEVRINFAMNHPGISSAIVDESIRNTLTIASHVQPFLIGRHDKLPKFDRGRADIDILREKAYAGLERHGTHSDPVYTNRLEEELGHIERGGLAPYMLMVLDVVEWAKSDRGLPDDNGFEKPGEKDPIEVGPGRGSAGGSLVSDSIGITNMDPIAYRLQFERFWNPNRKGMPDIDVDFPTDRIDEVEEYTKRKFGRKHVVDVIAHSTFGPRAAIRDVGRVLCLPHELIDRTAKSIDEDDRSPLEELRVVNTLVDQIATEHPEAWDHMTRLQGQIKGKSEHAAALLITPPEHPIQDVIPIERIGGMKGKLITAWGERAGKGNAILSDHGFNKFDWLRVRELDKQVYACKLIEQETGQRINLSELPVHRDPYAVDPEVMDAFGEGWLTGVFQFSATAKKLTKRVKPTNVLELAAINALIRPGPRGAGFDDQFARRKNGREEVTFWHERLEPYFDYTFGLMVFQEQLIEAVAHLGGLSMAEADNFRKIASKLYRDPAYAQSEMGKWRDPIRTGFLANGVPPEEFDDVIWPNFLSFSDYSFNLAHAAGYSLLAYRDMWLKVHYPRAFYAAFMSKGLPQKKERKAEEKEAAVREARMRRFDVLPPDVNESEVDYTMTASGIRIGLLAIKDVGMSSAQEILAKRVERPFTSYQDFDARVDKQRCNRTAKAALVCSGAFDSFGLRRDYTEEKIDELERETLGLSLTSHYSVLNYADILDPRIWPETDFDMAADETLVVVGGEIVGIKEHQSKNGLMCFVDLQYGANEWSCTFFAENYKLFKELIHSHRPMIVKGEKSTWKGRSSIVAFDAQDIETLAQQVRAGRPLAAVPAMAVA